MASPYDPVYPGTSFSGPGASPAKKGAPALTLPQARLLMASILPLKELTPQEAIKRVRFIQRQNFAAYLSHRKRILERLDGL